MEKPTMTRSLAEAGAPGGAENASQRSEAVENAMTQAARIRKPTAELRWLEWEVRIGAGLLVFAASSWIWADSMSTLLFLSCTVLIQCTMMLFRTARYSTPRSVAARRDAAIEKEIT